MYELIFQKTWPWWVGGPAIGLFALAYLLFQNRLLSASSCFQAVIEMVKGKGDPKHPHYPLNEEVGDLPVEVSDPAPRWRVGFLVGLVFGGLVSGMAAGGWGETPQLPGLGEFLGLGMYGQWLSLGLGGILIGFGTRFCGGCTSGHAIVGISGRQLPSVLATAIFFGTGMAATFFIQWMGG